MLAVPLHVPWAVNVFERFQPGLDIYLNPPPSSKEVSFCFSQNNVWDGGSLLLFVRYGSSITRLSGLRNSVARQSMMIMS